MDAMSKSATSRFRGSATTPMPWTRWSRYRHSILIEPMELDELNCDVCFAVGLDYESAYVLRLISGRLGGGDELQHQVLREAIVRGLSAVHEDVFGVPAVDKKTVDAMRWERGRAARPGAECRGTSPE